MITTVVRFDGDLDVFDQPQCKRTVAGAKHYILFGRTLFKRKLTLDIECTTHGEGPFMMYTYTVAKIH